MRAFPCHGRWCCYGLLLAVCLLSGPSSAAEHGVSSYWDGVAAGENYLAAGRWSEALTNFRHLAQAYPGSYESMLGQGRALLGARRYAEAVAPLRGAVHLRPDLPRPRVLLGRAYLRQKQYAPAEEALLAAYNLDPSYEPAWGELAGLYLTTGRPAQADAFLALQVARRPRDLVLLKSRLRVARSLHKSETVRGTLRQLIAVLPPAATAPYRRELALECLAARELPEAQAQLRVALRLKPNDTEAAILLGQVLLAAGKTAEAAAVLRGLPPGHVGRPELYLRLAQAEMAADQPAAALADARRALALAPNLEPTVALARNAALGCDEIAQVVAFSRRLVALHPRDAAARMRLASDLERSGEQGEALYQYHLAALAGGSLETRGAALGVLAERARAAGNWGWHLTVERRRAALSPPPPLELLDLLLEQRLYTEASSTLTSALPTAPGSPALMARRARLLRETGQWQQAAEVLRQALARHTQDPALNLEMGLLAAARSDPVAALPFLQRGLGTPDRLPQACRALAECAARCGQTEQAAQSLRAAVGTHPDLSPQATAALEGLALLYTLSMGAEVSAERMGALAQTQPERADLALAAAAQWERAGLPAHAGSYYEQAARVPAAATSALRRAAAAYAKAADAAGLLRVAATYLTQEAHDAEALVLVVEMQAVLSPPAEATQAAVLGLVEAEPWSVDYHGRRLELFTTRDRLELLASTTAVRAARPRGLGDRVAEALLQECRGDPAAALRTLSVLSPAGSAQPAVGLLRARLLQALGQPEAALQSLEGIVSPGAPEVALARGSLLSEANRSEEALAEYVRALSAGADPAGVLARIEELGTRRQISPTLMLAGLSGAYAALADPAPVRRFVADRLPADEPVVQAWLAAHPEAAS